MQVPHMHACALLHACMCTCAHVHARACARTCMLINACICMHAHARTLTCTHFQVYACMRTHMHAMISQSHAACTYARTHTHMHAHMQAKPRPVNLPDTISDPPTNRAASVCACAFLLPKTREWYHPLHCCGQLICRDSRYVVSCHLCTRSL